MKFYTRFFFSFFMLMAPISIAFSASNDSQYRIDTVTKTVEAIGAAGDSIKKLADGIKHLVITGVEGWDAMKARSTYSDLKNLSIAITGFGPANELAATTLDAYVQKPDFVDWIEVTDNLGNALNGTKHLLEKLKRERSDFVLESAYVTLSRSLNSRASLITHMQSISPPHTEEEMELLKEGAKQYLRLVEELSKARDELNVYIKKLKHI